MKNSLETLSYDEQVEAVLFGLESERQDFWLDLRARVGRTRGLDAQLNARYAESNDRMNSMLDQYGGLLMLSSELEDVKVLA